MILLVDDDPDVRATISQALVMLAYPVTEAEDGASALALFRDVSFDMAILDFAMPGMDGVEVADEMKKIDPEFPVIFASGFADERELIRLCGEDASILHKPFLMAELAELVDAALKPRQAAAAR